MYALRAARYETQDPELQYHAGIIALHTGYIPEARRRLREALAADRSFTRFMRREARRALAAMGG